MKGRKRGMYRKIRHVIKQFCVICAFVGLLLIALTYPTSADAWRAMIDTDIQVFTIGHAMFGLGLIFAYLA